VLGEAVDAAAASASSPLASLSTPTLIPAGATAGAPTVPPAAADVEMAEVPLPLLRSWSSLIPPFSTMRRGRPLLLRLVSEGLSP
jgi:hypothetical protein